MARNPTSKSVVSAAARAMRAKPGASPPANHRVTDSFQNFALRLGQGSGNAMDYSTYSFNPITRNRQLLENIHRGSWLAGIGIDSVADDMTREGIEWSSGVSTNVVRRLERSFNRWSIWGKLASTIKWSRLYGGALAVIIIDGQDHSTPLRIDTIGRNQFRGLLVLDRWMVDPSMGDLVTDLGPDLGLPKFYRVVSDSAALANRTVHHTRVLRMEGVELPHWQRLSESLWGMSVIERLYDRLLGFDAASAGAVQLVSKSYVRVVKIKGLRTIIGSGGKMLEKIYEQINQWRLLQGIEGITLLDADDDFEASSNGSFSGISDILTSLGQQISGAMQVPLVRLFGQSPSGLNSSGESDLRTYYDGITSQQERVLTDPVLTISNIMARSDNLEFDTNSADFEFRSLWQPTYGEKIQTGAAATGAILSAVADGVVDIPTALRELRALARDTGIWTTITDRMVKEAEMAPPPTPDPPSGGLEEGAIDPPDQSDAMNSGRAG